MYFKQQNPKWLAVSTDDDPREGAFLAIVLLVHHTDKGSVGGWFSNWCSMNQILQSLNTQVTGLFCQNKADGIHKVGLS